MMHNIRQSMPGKTQRSNRAGLPENYSLAKNIQRACYHTLAGILFVDQLLIENPVYAANTPLTPVSALSSVAEQRAVYKVRRSDNLLRIAKRLRTPSAHYYQIAAALFLKNPQAFTRHDPNKLKANKTLHLPDTAEIRSISLAQAKKIIKQGISSKKSSNHYAIDQVQSDNDNLLKQKFLVEMQAIETRRTLLQKNIPTPEQQKQDRIDYLLNLQQLIQQLEDTAAQHQENDSTYAHQLNQLYAKQEKLQATRRTSQQTNDELRAAITWDRFMQPKHFSKQEALHPNDFFRRVASLQRKQQPLSPLLKKAEALYCATNQQAAASLLKQFFNISALGTEWPDENLNQHTRLATLHAGTMDILLATLHRNIQRFPDLSHLSERVVLQWDYCALTGEGSGFYDLTLKHETLSSKQSQLKVPLHWNGFASWGFSTDPDADAKRYIPEILHAREPYHAYELFLHRTHRKHCFPHPETGKVYTENGEKQVFSRSIYSAPMTQHSEAYPYRWQPICDLHQVNDVRKAAWSPQMLQRSQAMLVKTESAIKALDANIATLQQERSEQQQSLKLRTKQLDQQIHVAKMAEAVRQSGLKVNYAAIAKLEALLTARRWDHSTLLQAQVLASVKQHIGKNAWSNANRLIDSSRSISKRPAVGKTTQPAAIERQGISFVEKQPLFQPQQRPQNNTFQVNELLAYAGVKGKKSGVDPTKFPHKPIQEVSPPETLIKGFTDSGGKQTESTINRRKRAIKALRKKLSHAQTVKFISNPPAKESAAQQVSAKNTQAKKTKQKQAPDKKLGIAATALYTIPASGDTPYGKLSLSWKPASNWFVRGAVKYIKDEDFTYSWGIGYSDWRPGTTSVQLNNWGPVKSGEGLDIDDAVLSISHRVDSEFLREHKLSATIGLSKPISGDAAFNATFQWSPIKNWYFRTTASQKLKGEPTKWSYGFGYYDWRPGTWRLEYSNYEKNRYPFDNFRQGAITINRSWEF